MKTVQFWSRWTVKGVYYDATSYRRVSLAEARRMVGASRVRALKRADRAGCDATVTIPGGHLLVAHIGWKPNLAY